MPLKERTEDQRGRERRVHIGKGSLRGTLQACDLVVHILLHGLPVANFLARGPPRSQAGVSLRAHEIMMGLMTCAQAMVEAYAEESMRLSKDLRGSHDRAIGTWTSTGGTGLLHVIGMVQEEEILGGMTTVGRIVEGRDI